VEEEKDESRRTRRRAMIYGSGPSDYAK